MKRCSLCKKLKRLKEFNINKSKKDGRQIYCRDCQKKKQRTYYQQNRQKFLADIYARRAKHREENRRKILEYLKGKKCADCPCNDIRVLEFDHVKGKKKREISKMVYRGYKWETIKRELKKCDIVCPTCHRLRTFKRQKAYRMGL